MSNANPDFVSKDEGTSRKPISKNKDSISKINSESVSKDEDVSHKPVSKNTISRKPVAESTIGRKPIDALGGGASDTPSSQ